MKKWFVLTMVIALVGCAHTREHKTQKGAALPADLQTITTYKFGQSRQPLNVVEDQVREAVKSSQASKQLAAQLAALLATDATPECKQFVCRQLVLIGTPAEAERLAPLLLDPGTADMARYALEAIPGAKVEKALIAALDDAPDSVKPGILNTLGARHTQRAAKAVQAYTTHANPTIADAAKSALEQIRG
ncbi:MAG: hypothetical protein HY706_17995 [Candidatus Hydrogenedentes bacterium]|nr:hypothetical protein [Candidatus Hydrogenedentota bacterium]